MKQTLLTLAAALLLLSATSCGNKAENVKLETERDTLSWAMGMSMAQTAKSGFYDFDEALMTRAFESVMNGEEQPLDEKTYNAVCQYLAFLAQQGQRKQMEQQSADAQKSQAELFAKLEADNPNIRKAPEGYYYEVLQEGKGPKAKALLRVKFDFRGSNMATGEVFEETYGHRDPIIHVIGKPMFQGMQYALQQMNAGSKYRFYFPYELVGPNDFVPPHTPVVYEIELHEIYND